MFDAYPITKVYNGLTAGYAYNRHLCNEPAWPNPVTGKRITDFRSTSTTFLFTEVVQLQSNGTLQEPFGGYFGSPYQPSKAITAFAVTAGAVPLLGHDNVAFLDGHVETRRPIDVAVVAPFNQATWDAAKEKFAGLPVARRLGVHGAVMWRQTAAGATVAAVSGAVRDRDELPSVGAVCWRVRRARTRGCVCCWWGWRCCCRQYGCSAAARQEWAWGAWGRPVPRGQRVRLGELVCGSSWSWHACSTSASTRLNSLTYPRFSPLTNDPWNYWSTSAATRGARIPSRRFPQRADTH